MKQLLILFLLASLMKSYSQEISFRPGLIITQSSDTIICLVPIASSFGNKILIKRNADSETEKIPLEQIKYMASAVNVYENISFKKKGKDIHKLMWLEYEGQLNLYKELENVVESTRYYQYGLQRSYKRAIQTFVIKKNESTYLIEEKNFIETITPLIFDNVNLMHKVATMVYNYENIEAVVREYDSIPDPVKDNEATGPTNYIPATSILFTDTAYQKIVHSDCDDKIFTKVETLPSIRGGENALTDSLLIYFKKQNTSIKGKAIFTFLITKNSELLDIEKLSGKISGEKKLKEGLLVYSNMWIPALQNSQKVCAIVRLEIEFKNGELLLKIDQRNSLQALFDVGQVGH